MSRLKCDVKNCASEMGSKEDTARSESKGKRRGTMGETSDLGDAMCLVGDKSQVLEESKIVVHTAKCIEIHRRTLCADFTFASRARARATFDCCTMLELGQQELRQAPTHMRRNARRGPALAPTLAAPLSSLSLAPP